MDAPKNILLVEPFLGASHARWAEGLARHSQHHIQILGLPARHWKWRMHGGAVTLAKAFMDLATLPDLILATDMLDLTSFLSLTRRRSSHIPVAIYFHENQLTYPWSPTDQDVQLRRDNHYAFINYTSALAADHVFFNSQYHLDSFLQALPPFLKSFPDKRNHDTIDQIRAKSSVLPLGMDLSSMDRSSTDLSSIDLNLTDQSPTDPKADKSTDRIPSKPETNPQSSPPPLLLWNHRWEYDKGPDEFFGTLIELKEEGLPFRLAVLGQSYSKAPPIFDTAKEKLEDRIVQWGYSENGYTHWLQRADCLPVTSRQDFFGGSVVEAMYHNCWPLLPDRLAYPEHIPEAFKGQCLYPEGKFKETLRNYLTQYDPASGIVPTADHSKVSSTAPTPYNWVQHYDWEISADQYDVAFGNLLSKS